MEEDGIDDQGESFIITVSSDLIAGNYLPTNRRVLEHIFYYTQHENSRLNIDEIKRK